MITTTERIRQTTPPLKKTRCVLTNLVNAYQYKNMLDPSFTKKDWTDKAGMASASIASALLSQKSISLDNAIRLAEALDISMDALMDEPMAFMKKQYGFTIPKGDKRFISTP